MRRMAPARVVPSLDSGEGRQARLGLGLEAALFDQLAFEAGEHASGHGVVVGVADGSVVRFRPPLTQNAKLGPESTGD